MDFLTEFAQTLHQPTPVPELLALQIAGLAYPDLQIAQEVARLDALAGTVAASVAGAPAGRTWATEFLRSLREDLGFQGNTANYYEPDNSFLNVVLDRRTGLPILLSLVCVALGRRLGVPMDGVGFPGHFMVRYRHADEQWLLDPFHGRVLPAGHAQEYLGQLFGQHVALSQQAYTRVTPPAFAQRILNNLRNVYLGNEDWANAVRVLDYMLLLLPSSTALLRERALLHHRVGDLERAAYDLQRYFTLTGELWSVWGLAKDEETPAQSGTDAHLRQLFHQIETARRRLN